MDAKAQFLERYEAAKREAEHFAAAEADAHEKKIKKLAEAETWRKAIDLLGSGLLSYPDMKQNVVIRNGYTLSVADEDNSESPDRRKGPRGIWRILLPKLLERFPDGPIEFFNIQTIAYQSGIKIEHASMRGQMNTYCEKGYFKRLSPGKFAFTPEGKEVAAGLSETHESNDLWEQNPSAAHDVTTAEGSSGGLPSPPEAS